MAKTSTAEEEQAFIAKHIRKVARSWRRAVEYQTRTGRAMGLRAMSDQCVANAMSDLAECIEKGAYYDD